MSASLGRVVRALSYGEDDVKHNFYRASKLESDVLLRNLPITPKVAPMNIVLSFFNNYVQTYHIFLQIHEQNQRSFVILTKTLYFQNHLQQKVLDGFQ